MGPFLARWSCRDLAAYIYETFLEGKPFSCDVLSSKKNLSGQKSEKNEQIISLGVWLFSEDMDYPKWDKWFEVLLRSFSYLENGKVR